MCTGPAEVPMMSPNGSIPPIHVPPGYISQVSATFIIISFINMSLERETIYILVYFFSTIILTLPSVSKKKE